VFTCAAFATLLTASAPFAWRADGLLLIAHRGASWDAPENTFAAWDRALEDGADWLELDLTRTSDGALAVFHDDTLGRTARGPAEHCTGRVADRTLTQLRHCEVGSWFNAEHPDRARAEFAGERIPLVDEVLTRYRGRARFYIELKRPGDAPGMEEALVAVLRRQRLVGPDADTGRVILQSFSAGGLQRLRALDARVPLVRLLEDPIPSDSLAAVMQEVARTAQGIGPSRRILTAAMVEAAHTAGLFVHVYTVNELAVLDWVRANGADGVFTDRPGLLLRGRAP
jgi:glycerophosphoryl diester phosphodiesterase